MTLVVGNNLNSSTTLNAAHPVSLDCHITESSWSGSPDTRISGTKIYATLSVVVNTKERCAGVY